VAFFAGGILMIVLWWVGVTSPRELLTLGTVAWMTFNSIALGLYVYSPEIYPTRMRALGSSAGTAWLRVASAIGPAVMGFVVGHASLASAFLVIGGVLLIGGIVTAAFAMETRGRPLEELSP
jgi:putative MFS transporter